MQPSSSDLLDACAQHVIETARKSKTDTAICGCWEVKYALSLTKNDFPVPREFVVIQTAGFGSCHFEFVGGSAAFDRVIGLSALDLDEYPIPYQIAGLDSVASTFDDQKFTQITLRGTNRKKILQRSRLLYDVVLRLCEEKKSPKQSYNVTMIGALGSVIKLLNDDPKVNVTAIDNNPLVVGRDYHGVKIRSSEHTREALETSDVVLITGMSLSNGGADSVLRISKQNSAKIVMYMQTGANLARPILAHGAHFVVSELYPFYFMGPGRSIIRLWSS